MIWRGTTMTPESSNWKWEPCDWMHWGGEADACFERWLSHTSQKICQKCETMKQKSVDIPSFIGPSFWEELKLLSNCWSQPIVTNRPNQLLRQFLGGSHQAEMVCWYLPSIVSNSLGWRFSFGQIPTSRPKPVMTVLQAGWEIPCQNWFFSMGKNISNCKSQGILSREIVRHHWP